MWNEDGPCYDLKKLPNSFTLPKIGIEGMGFYIARKAVLEKEKGYDGHVAFVSDGHIQTHLAQRDLNLGFRTGHSINPLERGHIAYRTDNLEAFKAHLTEKGIAFSDWGETAVVGWQQIFFYDPDGNIIEVHQIKA